MGIFYDKYINCSLEGKDYYENTPETFRSNHCQPRTIHFRWYGQNKGKAVQFFNYGANIQMDMMKTITTRGTLGFQEKKNSHMIYELRDTIEVPRNAFYFRVFDCNGYYTPLQTVRNNTTYFYEKGKIYELHK